MSRENFLFLKNFYKINEKQRFDFKHKIRYI